MSTFNIVPLPAFKDNYIWTLRDDRHAVVVDPGDAQPVFDYLAREGLQLSAILITHYHADHIGGLPALLAKFQVPVYGPAGEPIDGLTRRLVEGDTIDLPEFGLRFEVFDIPGHTRGHIAYYGPGLLFCGDTLFACGCGRLFEGTPEQMHRSLAKLTALPDDTKVYCTHEYTLSNIAFARAVEPGNTALAAREQREFDRREAGEPTLPSTIALEKATNPFVRTQAPEVIAAAQRHAGAAHSPVAVFAAIREWKNNF